MSFERVVSNSFKKSAYIKNAKHLLIVLQKIKKKSLNLFIVYSEYPVFLKQKI